ncbi:hypothetical protein CWI38_0769p0010 [Hamiltosporidium tvaerminnensis]|uniref:Uncharacterized protein n=1 Tax=Hamiltosporidium tvaerminnensis TaxID=1176355 RepID=A0A4Q9LUZ1_9MICR|nr:hypothetical protein CWI38_0769p0010 [Hamiltosporidium tvaerminnensis]
MYYLANRCKKILGMDIPKRINLGIGFPHLLFINIYNLKFLKLIKSDSVPEILDNEYAKNNSPEILILELEYQKNDILAKVLRFIYKCNVEIIPYVPTDVEVYIKTIVLKKETKHFVLLKQRLVSQLNAEESYERANMCTINENEKLNLEEGGEVVNTIYLEYEEENQMKDFNCLGVPCKDNVYNYFYNKKEAPVYIKMAQVYVASKNILKDGIKNDGVNFLNNSSANLNNESIIRQIEEEKITVKKIKRKKRWEGISDSKERLKNLYIS